MTWGRREEGNRVIQTERRCGRGRGMDGRMEGWRSEGKWREKGKEVGGRKGREWEGGGKLVYTVNLAHNLVVHLHSSST